MKFLVDNLPYYNEDCPFMDGACYTFGKGNTCPRNWSTPKIYSENNPRECVLLKEFNKYTKENEND